jgi:hypothetical protein
MRARTVRLARRLAALVALCLLTFLAVRAWDSQRGLPLEPWHTFVPDELRAGELEHTDWAGYLAAEQVAFDQVRAEVTQQLDATSTAAPSTPAASPTTGTAPTSWSRTARPSVPPSSCTA